MHYDLFIDESGTFTETSKGPGGNREGDSNEFPSQLAGVLAPSGQLTAQSAHKLMTRVQQSVQIEYNGEFHANKYKPGQNYDERVKTLAGLLSEKKWQPVRIVNTERVHYGNHVETYTNMVAELIVRICEKKQVECSGDISISLHYAVVNLQHDKNRPPVFIEKWDYIKRIQEYLAFRAIRQGLASQASGWKVKKTTQKSGLKDPEMHICDLISNASFDNFRKSGEEAKDALKSCLGHYDFSMTVHLAMEQADYFIGEGLYSLALRVIAERLVQDDGGGEMKADAKERVDLALGRMARLSAMDRNSQLAMLTEWMGQVINQNRSLDLGRRLSRWLLDNVGYSLRDMASPEDRKSYDWFIYALHVWGTTACNHQGDLLGARSHSKELNGLLASVAGKWEHVPILMEGLVAQAVHLTDCFDHDEACKRMALVSDYYGDLSGFFNSMMPDLFPERVVSDLRGKALGTWLQAEMYAALYQGDSARLDKAREINDLAIDEFADKSEKVRQYQYRSQVEAFSGNFGAARAYLAKSLGVNEDSHGAIADVIKTIDIDKQGFPLQHWLRIGACSRGDAAEWGLFIKALDDSRLAYNKWYTGEQSSYFPVHAILRWAAIISAARGEEKPSAVGRLQAMLNSSDNGPILSVIMAAALVEVAGLKWKSSNEYAKALLDSRDKSRPGVKQVIGEVSRQYGGALPGMRDLCDKWGSGIGQVLGCDKNDGRAADLLMALGRMVGY